MTLNIEFNELYKILYYIIILNINKNMITFRKLSQQNIFRELGIVK